MTLSVAIRKRLGDFQLDVAFEAHAGVTALFGRSGSGKSTVLNAIAGLIGPDEGRIVLDDVVLADTHTQSSVPVHRRRVAMVFQDARLFPHMSVMKNLLYGAKLADKTVTRADGQAMANLLGLGDKVRRRPASLSGGEAQRVAIGRALLSKPKLLMMDEPLSGLDQARKGDVLALIEKVRDVVGVPILYVSHAREEVTRLADHVVVLKDGRVTNVGTPSSVLGDDEDNRLIRTLQARLVLKNASDGMSELAITGGRLFVPQVDAPLGTMISVDIAARDVMLSLNQPDGLSALNVLPCTITDLKPTEGNPVAVDVYLDCSGEPLAAQVTRRSVGRMGLEPGQTVYAVIKSVALGQTSGLVAPVHV